MKYGQPRLPTVLRLTGQRNRGGATKAGGSHNTGTAASKTTRNGKLLQRGETFKAPSPRGEISGRNTA